MGNKRDGSEGKVELPKAGGEGIRKKGRYLRDYASDKKWPFFPLFPS